jgi:hypothetical protein
VQIDANFHLSGNHKNSDNALKIFMHFVIFVFFVVELLNLGLCMVLMVCVLLPGCASLISKSAYPVFIDNATGPAQFVITNHNNVEMARGQTPAIIILESGAGYFEERITLFIFPSQAIKNRGMVLLVILMAGIWVTSPI